MEKHWRRALFLFLGGWVLLYYFGPGGFPSLDLRRIALWAAIALGFFLLIRDGPLLFRRLGMRPAETPLSILELRLAKGEIDLATYRALRAELLSAAGITGDDENR